MASEAEEVQDLFDRISGCLPRAVEFRSCVFRSAGVRYANEDDLTSGIGASDRGGRWNPRGVRAVYYCLSPETAVKESYQEFLAYGFLKEQIRPRVLAGLAVNVKRLLDLTDTGNRRRLGFRLDELVGEDWRAIQSGGEESWTQAIGRGAMLAGFEGLLAPSARDRGGTVVVIFPGKLEPTSTVEPMAKEDLPPHPSAWPE